MKRFAWLGLGLLVCAFSNGAVKADSGAPADARAIMHLSTDASETACDIYVTVDGSNALTGLGYICGNHPDVFKRYTLDDLHTGIAFSKDKDSTLPFAVGSNVTVATIIGPTVDAVKGGDVNIHYVSNGILGEYKDYPIELEAPSGSWGVYTSDDDGHRHFDQIFMKKKTSLGATIGVDCISVSLWPDQPATSCSN